MINSEIFGEKGMSENKSSRESASVHSKKDFSNDDMMPPKR